ncbi:MAG TPA: hypothetical protein VLE73_04245 [Candidatus Saccharimonadales bacterium]|nr:hypothetical protein [Candidatus Saccharimonadales bacterium]
MGHQEYNEYFVETAAGVFKPAPLVLAEQLTADQVWEYNRNPAHQGPTDLRFEQGSANLELALCLPRPENQGAFARAKTIFTDIYRGVDSRKQYAAGIFLDYMPVYARRMECVSIPSSTRRQLYERLGRKALSQAHGESGAALGNFYETTFLGLCAGMEDERYLAFPASVREEASSPRHKNYNHDAYWVHPAKVPVQLKSSKDSDSKTYESTVPKIAVRDYIMRSAVDVYGQDRWQATRRSSPRRYSMPRSSMAQLFRLTGECMIADAEQRHLPKDRAEYLALLEYTMQRRIDTIWAKYSHRAAQSLISGE